MVLFTLSYSMFYCLSSGGISAFSALILSSFKLDAAQTIAYQIPWYVVQCIGMASTATVCHKFQKYNVNLLCCMACCVPAIIGIFLQGLLTNDHRWARIAGYWITGFFAST